MSKLRWLDVVEYVSVSSSVVGLVASAISQQVIFASAPLTFSILFNLINRQRLNRDIENKVLPNLHELGERTAKDSQVLLSLRRKVLALPTPDDLNGIKDAYQAAHQETLMKLDASVDLLKSEMESRLEPLEKLDLDPLKTELSQLKTQTAGVQTSLTSLNDTLGTFSKLDQVQQVEASITQLAAENRQLQADLKTLASQPEPDLTPLQEHIDNLYQLMAQLPPPFNPASLQATVEALIQEVERSSQVMSTFLPRHELAGILTEIEKLRQRQQGLGQSLSPLREMMTGIQTQLDRLAHEFSTRMEPGLVEEVRRALFKVAAKVRDLQQDMTKLTQGNPGLNAEAWRTELRQEVALQTEVISHQLGDVQQALIDLNTDLTNLQNRAEVLRALQQEMEIVRQTLQSLDQDMQQVRHQVAASIDEPTADLEAVRLQLSAIQQVVQTLTHEQQLLQNRLATSSPDQSSDAMQVQVEVLTAKLEEIENHFRQQTLENRQVVPVQRSSSARMAEQTGPEGYRLMVEHLDSQAVLEEALQTVQSRLIVVSSWLEQCRLDASLFDTFERLLNQGVRIDIGWSSYNFPETPLVPRRINQLSSLELPEQSNLLGALKQFKQMEKNFPERLRLIALATQERLLVCDRAFAVLVRHPVNHAASEKEMGLCTADAKIIEHLIDSFDNSATDTEDALTCFKRADTRYELGDMQGVISDYTQGLRLDANHDIALNNRGVAYYALGGRERSIEDFNRALEINAENADAYFNRGVAWAELGERDAALQDYTEVVKLNPNDAIAYNNRGLVRSKLGDYEGAEADYSDAIGINPNSNIAYNNRGLVRSKLGNKIGAIADYTEALRLNPNDDTVYFNRGAVRAGLDDFQGAIADYTAAIRLNPEFVNAYNNRGFVYQKLGNKQAAIEDFNRAIEINPNFANAYNNRGTARSKLKDFEGAIKDFNQALQINPNFANAYNNRGTARSKLKDFEGAIQDFNRALQVNPYFANAYNNRGLARADMGNQVGAIEDLLRAAQLFRDQGDEVGSRQALETADRFQHQASLADMPIS